MGHTRPHRTRCTLVYRSSRSLAIPTQGACLASAILFKVATGSVSDVCLIDMHDASTQPSGHLVAVKPRHGRADHVQPQGVRRRRRCGAVVDVPSFPVTHVLTTCVRVLCLVVFVATHSDYHTALQRKLREDALTQPLFQTHQYTQALEASQRVMYDLHTAVVRPYHIAVGK